MISLLDTACEQGFSEKEAQVLVGSTFEGAVHLFKKTNIDLEAWIDRVVSKDGTTEIALKSFDENRANKLIKNAVMAALERAIEMGKE